MYLENWPKTRSALNWYALTVFLLRILSRRAVALGMTASAFMTLRALEARSTQSRAWGAKVKWVSSVTLRILGVLFGGATASPTLIWGWSRDWWVSEVNSVTLDFWRAMASCLPSAHLTKEEHCWFALVSASTKSGVGVRGESLGLRG